MKYIDAEKLTAEIERFSAIEFGDNTLGDDVAKGALDYVLEEIIPSLQQEQSEVEFEKEVEHWLNMMPVIIGKKWLSRIARHFYELGLNARKEE